MNGTLDGLLQLLSSGGIAAVVAATVVYLMKTRLDAGMRMRVDRQLETIRAELALQNEHLAEILRIRLEILPGLVEAIYRSRNLARDLKENLWYQADLRSRLGDLALLITERLYEVRALLSPDLFEQLHEYKSHLQGFLFDYDRATGLDSEPPPALLESLGGHYENIDELYGSVVEGVQAALHIQEERA